MSGTTPNADRIAYIKHEVSNLSTVFCSPDFYAMIQVEGTDAQGSPFHYTFIMDQDCAEFKKMINDIGARKSAELLVPNVNLGI